MADDQPRLPSTEDLMTVGRLRALIEDMDDDSMIFVEDYPDPEDGYAPNEFTIPKGIMKKTSISGYAELVIRLVTDD